MKDRNVIISFLIICSLTVVLALTGSDFESLFKSEELPKICYRVYTDGNVSSSDIIARATKQNMVISISAVKIINFGEEPGLLLCADLYGDSGAIALSGRVSFNNKEISEKKRVISVPSYCESAIGSTIQIFDNTFAVIGRNSSQNYYCIPLATFEDINDSPDYYVVRYNGRLKGLSKIVSKWSLRKIMGNNTAELFLGDDGLFFPRFLIFLAMAFLPFMFLFLYTRRILDYKTCRAGLIVIILISVVVTAGFLVIKTVKAVESAIKCNCAESCYKRLDSNGAYYMTDWSLTIGNRIDHDDLYTSLKDVIRNTYEIRYFEINECGFNVMLLDDSLIGAFLETDADTVFSPSGIDESGRVEVIAFRNGILPNEVNTISVIRIERFNCLPRLNANNSNLSILDLVTFDKNWLVGRRTDQTLELLSKTGNQLVDTNFLFLCEDDLTTYADSSVTQKGALWTIKDAVDSEENRIRDFVLLTIFISHFLLFYIASCLLTYKAFVACYEKDKIKRTKKPQKR